MQFLFAHNIMPLSPPAVSRTEYPFLGNGPQKMAQAIVIRYFFYDYESSGSVSQIL
jgi:hypothetical protein